jgi:hypothetical protein
MANSRECLRGHASLSVFKMNFGDIRELSPVAKLRGCGASSCTKSASGTPTTWTTSGAAVLWKSGPSGAAQLDQPPRPYPRPGQPGTPRATAQRPRASGQGVCVDRRRVVHRRRAGRDPGPAIDRKLAVREVATPIEAVRSRHPDGVPPGLADALVEGLRLMPRIRSGLRTDTVRQLPGRRPRTSADWCRRNADAFAPSC